MLYATLLPPYPFLGLFHILHFLQETFFRVPESLQFFAFQTICCPMPLHGEIQVSAGFTDNGRQSKGHHSAIKQLCRTRDEQTERKRTWLRTRRFVRTIRNTQRDLQTSRIKGGKEGNGKRELYGVYIFSRLSPPIGPSPPTIHDFSITRWSLFSSHYRRSIIIMRNSSSKRGKERRGAARGSGATTTLNFTSKLNPPK